MQSVGLIPFHPPPSWIAPLILPLCPYPPPCTLTPPHPSFPRDEPPPPLRAWLLSDPGRQGLPSPPQPDGQSLAPPPLGPDAALRVLGWVQSLLIEGLWGETSTPSPSPSPSSSSSSRGPSRAEVEALERKGRLLGRLLLLFSDVPGAAGAVVDKVWEVWEVWEGGTIGP